MLPVEFIDLRCRNLRRAESGVERGAVHFAPLEIHHRDAESIRLDAQIDVLADENHPTPLALEVVGDAENPVVRRGVGQFTAESGIDLAGHRSVLPGRRRQHEQLPGRGGGNARKRHPQTKLPGLRQRLLPQAVEITDHLPRVAAELVGVLLELVQLRPPPSE